MTVPGWLSLLIGSLIPTIEHSGGVRGVPTSWRYVFRRASIDMRQRLLGSATSAGEAIRVLRLIVAVQSGSLWDSCHSHPFVERLIGTVWREFLDHVLFWTAADLERQLEEFQSYYNAERVHASLDGVTPLEFGDELKPNRTNLSDFKWQSHCRGIVELPIAA